MRVSENIKKDIRRVPAILAFLLAAAYGASAFASYHWALDLFSHFTFQYLISTLVLLPFVISLREWKTTALLVVIALFCFSEIFSVQQFRNPDTSGSTITVLQYNRHATQTTHDDLKAYLVNHKPDIVVLQESNPTVAEMTGGLREIYPYQSVNLNRNPEWLLFPLGIIILSRFPMEEVTVHGFDDLNYDNNYVRASVIVPDIDEPIILFAMHPHMPMGNENWTERNLELEIISKNIMQEDSSHILYSGDFNTTPYSPFLRRLLRKTGLNLSYDALGPIPTWPSFNKFSLLQIPIDHILFSDGFRLTRIRRLPPMGSDHYPLLAEFSIIP
ncbi:MAG: endonuclease/exonuclease/phosphatase family protein [Micavibrio aeruginosavorus]|nr:endonuclease/exonuclease/phosphatase family protein [Micavibrio aeruginosavorus]